MFFTQDDYKKIQQWLTKNSVRDTEFNEANIPFNGGEIITIVQDNQNKKVPLRDLVRQIFNLGVSDFINVTDKYDAPNIDLNEAIKLIPSRARKEGQVITFLNKENNWQIYQFRGVLNQWSTLDKWEDLFDWEKFVIDSFLPDEEDLTKSLPDENGNSYLSLKDREYNPNDFSGLGRIILRKNIVEIEDPVYGKVKKNILYQDMFILSNTIYEIRYDFDLNNQEITIPNSSTLIFIGGHIKNGKIIYNNTRVINAFDVYSNINITGNITNIITYPEYFGAIGDGITDDSIAVLNAINNSTNIIFNGNYLLKNNIYILTDGITIGGHGTFIFDCSTSHSASFILECVNVDGITIKDISIVSKNGYSGVQVVISKEINTITNIKPYTKDVYKNYYFSNIKVDNYSSGYREHYYGTHCIGVRSWDSGRIEGVKIINCVLDGAGVAPNCETSLDGSDNIYVAGYKTDILNIIITGNTCKHPGRNGISVASSPSIPGRYITISNNYILDTRLAGIDLEEGAFVNITNNCFINCGYDNSYYQTDDNTSMRSGITLHSKSIDNVNISLCIFHNCYRGISGYDIRVNRCTFYNSSISLGSNAWTRCVLDNCNIIADANMKTSVIALYTGFNRFVDCDILINNFVGKPINILGADNTLFSKCKIMVNGDAQLQVFYNLGGGSKSIITFSDCTINSSGYISLIYLNNCGMHMQNCNISCENLVASTYSYTLSFIFIILDSNIECTTISQSLNISALNKWIIRNNCITLHLTSSIPSDQSIEIAGNMIYIANDFNSTKENAIIFIYPLKLIFLIKLENNYIYGLDSTKRFLMINYTASTANTISSVLNNVIDANSENISFSNFLSGKSLSFRDLTITGNKYRYNNIIYPLELYKSYGDSTSRPTLRPADVGYLYYDNSLNKLILWNGSNWVNVDGTSL